MAMGRQKDGQGDLMVSWAEMPRSPDHVFYDCLQSVLIEGNRSLRPWNQSGRFYPPRRILAIERTITFGGAV